MYDMAVTLDNKRSSYSTVKNWVARFRTGYLSVEDERSGRTTPENLDAIHFMIQDT
jgi:transposase